MADEYQTGLPALVKDAAQAVRADLDARLTLPDGASLDEAVRGFLRGYLVGSPYRAASGVVVGERDPARGPFGCLVIAGDDLPPLSTREGMQLVPADSVYGSIETCRVLDPSTLREAANRIAELKCIHRRPLYREKTKVNAYLGVILAAGGLHGPDLLEAVGAENDGRSFEEQVDMVCVLDKGVVGHAEVGEEGPVSIELPLEASPRWRLTWLGLEERTTFAFLLSVWETLASRSLRPPRLHILLRALRTSESAVLAGARGISRGE